MDVAVLKSWDFADWQRRYGAGWQLPYRMDYLQAHGLNLKWSDTVQGERWARSRAAGLVRRAEGVAAPFAQTALMARAITSAPATLALFESEATALAAARRASRPSRRAAMVVISCWLAEVLSRASRARRAGYRAAYSTVDRIFYFSANQRSVLADILGGEERLRLLPFGVDSEMFRPPGPADAAGPPDAGDSGYVLVVGRDRGRDWPTLWRALDGIGLPVKVCCRPQDVAGQRIPAGVDLLGYVDRVRYRDLLGRATVVVVAVKPLLYPSGQSVMLEAMAMGRAVVVTETPALADYQHDGVSCLTVPAGEPGALRDRIVEAAGDSRLRRLVGAGGRAAVEESFSAERMWATVAADITALVAECYGHG